MARIAHGAVFFVGDLVNTTLRFAGMTANLCKRYLGPDNVAFMSGDDLLKGRHLQFNDHPRTILVHGALNNSQHVQYLYDFDGGVAIVHVDLQGDPHPSTPPEIQSVIGTITDVPIIHLVEHHQEDEASRLCWILNRLAEVNKKPIPPKVIESALNDKKTLHRVMHLPARSCMAA